MVFELNVAPLSLDATPLIPARGSVVSCKCQRRCHNQVLITSLNTPCSCSGLSTNLQSILRLIEG